MFSDEPISRSELFFERSPKVDGQSDCPFCEGQEARTPPEIFAIRRPGSAPNAPGWLVRVVSSRSPLLRIEGNVSQTHLGMFTHMEGIGAHEVIIEAPQHDTDVALLSHDHVAAIVRTYLQRYLDLDRDQRFCFTLLFRKHDHRPPEWVSHPHSQLLAFPVVPHQIAEELQNADTYFSKEAMCAYCDLISQELLDGSRSVYQNEQFLAIAPFASRFPFEMWILPKTHMASFGSVNDDAVPSLSDALKSTLAKLSSCLDDPPYDLFVHSAPYGEPGSSAYSFHWHVEILPRPNRTRRIDRGCGIFTNSVLPEKAARTLREAPVGG